ncbi:hypothetical protein EI982_04150 [Haloplanus rallus]|uniref:NRDE family protein n=1 Tax=Haloplanus rallus TaxID=1816183 RepID=A0A6B9F6J0_9EURY|nr:MULTISPECIES: NRDE family protein [Haloplanus]QGX94027.1 hypothetical protein EI982_04150 [Haloplanus rallus]
MCTLTLAWQTFVDAPVLVAANRDERRDRPAEPPEWTGSTPAVIAPRDAEAGGTWIGYNDAGLFVGITNRPMANPTAERSRGLLVDDALREPDARSAARLVERAVETDGYDGFNLVVADRSGAFLFEWDGRLRTHRLDPGVHVVVNSGAALGGGGAVVDAFRTPGPDDDDDGDPNRAAEQAANARAVRAALTPEPGEAADAWLDRAGTVLGDHEFGVCIHADGYGTRSSSLLRLDDDGGTYRFADGPPCETPYRRVETDESQL